MSNGANQPNSAGWGSDFFGALNDLPPEPVTGIGHILEAMATLPTRDTKSATSGQYRPKTASSTPHSAIKC
jgi:hypothetical protein